MRGLLLAAAMLAPVPVLAQDHSAHGSQPSAAEKPPAAPAGHDGPGDTGHGAPDAGRTGDQEPMDHEAMDHEAMDHATDHAGMDHGAGSQVPQSAGPPPRALEGPAHAADAIYGTSAMADARREAAGEDAMPFGTIIVERLEARLGKGEDNYLWDAQGWYGGDFDKLWLKSEGEGAFGGDVERAELQALWSHAIGPFFDLQAGVRYDFEPDSRAHAVLGVQGLAPYMFEIDAAAFLSDRGDLTARVEAEYDQRITQRLILQPRAELLLAAQDIPERGLGAGLTSLEAGLRLRYEIVREFAPYVGVEYEAKLGETADRARAIGEDPGRFRLVVGLRTWF